MIIMAEPAKHGVPAYGGSIQHAPHGAGVAVPLGISANVNAAGSYRPPVHHPAPHHIVGSHRLPAHPGHHPHHIVGQHPLSQRAPVPGVTVVYGQPLAKRATASTPSSAPVQLQQDGQRNVGGPTIRSVRPISNYVSAGNSAVAVAAVSAPNGAEAAMVEKRDARIRDLERELHEKRATVMECEGELADLRRQRQQLQHSGCRTSENSKDQATQGHLHKRQDHEWEAVWQMAKAQDHEGEACRVQRRSQEQQPMAQHRPSQLLLPQSYHGQPQQRGGEAQPGGRPFQPAARAPLDTANIGDRRKPPQMPLGQRDGLGKLGGSTVGSVRLSVDEVATLSSQRCASLTDLDFSQSVASQSVATIGDIESEEVDERLSNYFEAHPDFQLEVTKVRRGWYRIGQPVNKKVHIKMVGKNAVLKVGGGYQALTAFLDQKRAAATSGLPSSRTGRMGR